MGKPLLARGGKGPQAGEFGQLFELLSDEAFFSIAHFFDQAQTQRYWALLERDERFQMTDAYRAVIERPDEHLPAAVAVSALLNATGHWEDCGTLNQRLIDHCRRTGRRLISASMDCTLKVWDLASGKGFLQYGNYGVLAFTSDLHYQYVP
jgi:hypothetical protein